MKSAILAIRIIGDATQAVAAMDKAERASMSFKDKVGKASVAAGAATCAKSAADLQQSVGGVETVFGDSSSKMLEWSNNAAQAVGLSKNEYNEFATLVGSQLQNFGMSVEDSATKTNDLIGLGADLSSMFGGTTADAVDALSSALKGEMDPIEKYGISLNDATLQAQAASMGLGDLYKSGDRNAKMQATLAAITAQSGKAVGNFAREADTAQGQQQRMAASFENAKAALGEALLPALTAAASKLAEFATWVQANSSWLVPLVGVIAAVAAIIVVLNAAMTAYSVVAGIVAVAQGSVNLAFLPVIAVIVAVIAVIALLVMNWDIVKKAGAAAAQWISDKWNAFVSWLSGIGASIKQWGSDTWDGIKNTAKGAVDGIANFFGGLKDKVLGVFDSIIGGIKKAFSWVSDLWGKITGASSAASGLSAQSYSAQAYVPVSAYSMARTITPMAARGHRVPPTLTRAVISTVANRADAARPVAQTININVDAHGNLDNDSVAGEIVTSLNRWARVRGRELAL
jgi:hypothetical protein